MSSKALTALAFLVFALLAVVVIVGLAQRALDATGVAVVLGSMFTGIVGGAALRQRSTRDDDR